MRHHNRPAGGGGEDSRERPVKERLLGLQPQASLPCGGSLLLYLAAVCYNEETSFPELSFERLASTVKDVSVVETVLVFCVLNG